MTTSGEKKHSCPDCRQCQQCAETRCRVCRGQGARAAESRWDGLSLQEQIAFYEEVNRPNGEPAASGAT